MEIHEVVGKPVTALAPDLTVELRNGGKEPAVGVAESAGCCRKHRKCEGSETNINFFCLKNKQETSVD